MLGLLAIFEAAKEAGMWDLVMYTGGVSGSCWALGGMAIAQTRYTARSDRCCFDDSLLYLGRILDKARSCALREALDAVRVAVLAMAFSTR